jgi:hypothetical protein
MKIVSTITFVFLVTLFPVMALADTSVVSVHMSTNKNTVIVNGQTITDEGTTVVDVRSNINGKQEVFHKVIPVNEAQTSVKVKTPTAVTVKASMERQMNQSLSTTSVASAATGAISAASTSKAKTSITSIIQNIFSYVFSFFS